MDIRVKAIDCIRVIVPGWDKTILLKDLHQLLDNMKSLNIPTVTMIRYQMVPPSEIWEMVVQVLNAITGACKFLSLQFLINDDLDVPKYAEFQFEERVFSMPNVTPPDGFFSMKFFQRVKELIIIKQNESFDKEIIQKTVQDPKLCNLQIEEDPSFYRFKF